MILDGRGLLAGVLGSAALCLTANAAFADEAGPLDEPLPSAHASAGADKGPDTPAEVNRSDIATEYFTETRDGFHVAYHPAVRERVRELSPRLASIRDELSQALGMPVLAEVELRIAALPIEIERLAPSHEGLISEHGGYSFADRHLIIVSLAGADALGEDLEAALRHHLAHVAVAQATNGAVVPGWFEEGFAVHFANTRAWSRWLELEKATLGWNPTSLAELPEDLGPRRDAARADFARFASSERKMPAIFDGLRRGVPFDRALEDAFGTDASKIDRAWRKDNTWRYGVVPIALLVVAFGLAALAIRLLGRRRRARASVPARHLHRTRNRALARRRETKLRVPLHVADQSVPRVEHDGGWHTLH